MLRLRIELLRGTVQQKLVGNHRQALTIFSQVRDSLQSEAFVRDMQEDAVFSERLFDALQE